MKATFHFTIGGVTDAALIVWDHETTTVAGPYDLTGSGPDIVDALIARYLTPAIALISNQVVLTHVALRNYLSDGDGYDGFGTLFTGGSVNAMLPVFVSTSIQLIRTNYVMRNGRKAYPGPCITDLNANGTMKTATQAAWEVITDAWATTDLFVEASGGDITFSPRIVRDPVTEGVNPSVWSRIGGYGLAKHGTQNTRKP